MEEVVGGQSSSGMTNNNNNNNKNNNNNENDISSSNREVVVGKKGAKKNNSNRSMMMRVIMMMSVGSLVYYHCAYRNSSILSLISDVFIVLLSSLAILGLLFRHLSISVPVDPLEWQISQEWANNLFANFANTIGAAESVLRVAATGHDKRLFGKVVLCLYLLSVLGRLVAGVTVAYAGLCLFCIYMLAENSQLVSASSTLFLSRRDSTALEDNI